MEAIRVEHSPSEDELERLDVRSWDTWSCEPSTFPWTYDDEETCFLLQGDVVVTPDGGAPVRIGAGDLVTFPRGLACTWEVRVAVHKHFRFGGGEPS